MNHDVLKAYRRHEDACPHREKGQGYTDCDCPIWADGKLGGKRFRKSTGLRDWARANKKIDKWLEDPKRAALRSGSLQTAVAAYLADCEARNVRASTRRRYGIALAHLKVFAKNWGATDVATLDVQAITAYRQTRKAVVAVTQAKELQVVRSFLSWCESQKLVDYNAAAKVKPPLCDSAPTLPFTSEQIAAMLKACDGPRVRNADAWAGPRMRAKALLLVLVYSGLRISDAIGLRRDQVDLATGKIMLYTAKTGVPVYLTLHRDAVDALAALPDTGACFFWNGATKLTSAAQKGRRAIAAIAKAAGVADAHPHRFRDTFAVQLLLNGVLIETVSRLLGHTSVKTTERHYAPYVSAFQARLDAATATLDFGASSQGPAPHDPVEDRRRNAKRNVIPFVASAATA